MKTCVLVLGMHRSGTSAVTGILEKLGAGLPQELLVSQKDNPKGYFEGVHVVELNERFLEELHSNWDDTRFPLLMPDPMIDKHLDRVKEFIENEFAYTKVFALKDPRICITFPLWERALKELKINIKVVFPYRNPFEVARSLKSRNDFSTEKSLLLWAKYVLYAEKYSRPYQRYFLNFNTLLANSKEEAGKIADFIGMDCDFDDMTHAYEDFLEKGLKHHNLDLKNVADEVPLFLKKLLAFVEANSFSKATAEDFDTIFNELRSLYKLMHTYDVQFQSNISRALHAQRDQANDRADRLEQQLNEQQKSSEQIVQNQKNQLIELETEKKQLEIIKAELVDAQRYLEEQRAECEQAFKLKVDQLNKLQEEKQWLEKIRVEENEENQSKVLVLESDKAELLKANEQLNLEIERVLIDLVDVKYADNEKKEVQKDTIEQQLKKQQRVNGTAIHALECKLVQLKSENDYLRESYAEGQAQFQLKIDALDNAKMILTKERDKLNDEVQTLSKSIDCVIDDLSHLKESKCWAYTKPLRYLSEIFKKQDLERQ